MSYIKCMSNDVYDKCLRVIDSCDKIDQLDVALKELVVSVQENNTKNIREILKKYVEGFNDNQ